MWNVKNEIQDAFQGSSQGEASDNFQGKPKLVSRRHWFLGGILHFTRVDTNISHKVKYDVNFRVPPKAKHLHIIDAKQAKNFRGMLQICIIYPFAADIIHFGNIHVTGIHLDSFSCTKGMELKHNFPGMVLHFIVMLLPNYLSHLATAGLKRGET